MILSYFLPLSLYFNQRRKQEERLKPVSGTSCWGIMRCRSPSIGPENTCGASSPNSINPELWLELAGAHLAS